MTEKKFDRSKFRGTKLSKLKDKQQEAKKKDVNFYKGGGNRTFHQVEEGVNVFRIMPPHNPENLSYYPIRTSMLKCEVPVYEDGEDTGNTEVRNKKIFIATVHGDKKVREINKDPIEEYVGAVYDIAGDIDGKDERRKFLAPITGYKDKKKQWHPGIRPQTNFVCYAIKDGNIGQLELYENYMKEMNKIQAQYDEAEDEELLEDIFSNPDEGYPLIIKKEPSSEKNRKWDIDISEGKLQRGQTWEDFFEENMVTDAQLKELMDMPSLKEKFVDVYSKRDFDLAVDGLKRFDEENKYGVFEDPEFIEALKEIEAVVPDKQEKKDDKDVDKAFKEKKPSNYTKIKAKKLLKAYIDENYEDMVDEYNAALSELSPDELREWYDLAMQEEELPELTEPEEADESSEEKNEEEEKGDVEIPEGTDEGEDDDDMKAELAKLRAKRRRK